MTIAKKVAHLLSRNRTHYYTVQHPRTKTALETAKRAHIAEHLVVKSVVLKDEDGYLMAVIPASRRLDFKKLNPLLNRQLELSSEAEVEQLFSDCEVGAIPPFGSEYDIKTVVDDRLAEVPGLYLEGGDHEQLIHMGRGEFQLLMDKARHGDISQPAQ